MRPAKLFDRMHTLQATVDILTRSTCEAVLKALVTANLIPEKALAEPMVFHYVQGELRQFALKIEGAALGHWVTQNLPELAPSPETVELETETT